MNYLNRLNLNEIQQELQKLIYLKNLSEYIGRKVMTLEIERSGISINDNALRNIINDKLFFKDSFQELNMKNFQSSVSVPHLNKILLSKSQEDNF